MPNTIEVLYDLDLSGHPSNATLSLVVREAGAARLIFGVELFDGTTPVKPYAAWADHGTSHLVYMLDEISFLRGKNLDVFGRAFPGQPDTAKVWCEFYVGATLIGKSGPANMTFDDTQASIDFSINTLFQ